MNDLTKIELLEKNQRVFVVIIILIDRILTDRLQLTDKTASVALVFYFFENGKIQEVKS